MVFITIGYIRIYASHLDTAPISAASVRVYKLENQNIIFEHRCKTNADGFTEAIALEAPVVEHSLQKNHTTLPYTPYTVEVSRRGYDTEVRVGVQIFPSIRSTMQVEMNPIGSPVPRQNVIVIDDHKLANIEGDPNA